MKLHLGCGKRNFGKEWVHIDAGIFPHVTSHDIVSLPFDDASCDLIYASHVLEYFDREEVVSVLTEWHRVLKAGGIIRLAVPNFREMARLYIDSIRSVNGAAWKIEAFLGPLYGRIIPSGIDTSVDNIYCESPIYHKTAYDFRSLRELLISIGFCNIHTYDWQKTEHAHIDDHSQAFLPHMDKDNGTLISLNMEAIKGH